MITDTTDNMTEQEARLLSKLTEERNLQQGLAQAQLQSLLLKQKQLKMLEEKLALLEKMELEQSLENEKNMEIVKDLAATPSAAPSTGAAAADLSTDPTRQLDLFQQESSSTLIHQDDDENIEGVITTDAVEENQDFDQEALMQEMINNPEFQLKISQLQRQSQELAYLEQQLASLKDLKSKMMEKQQLMSEITQEQELVLELEGKVDEHEQDKVLDQARQIVSSHENLQVEQISIPDPLPDRKENDYSELEAATSAMENYLDIQSTMRKNGREPTSDELATESIALEHLMQRLMTASTLDVVDSKAFREVAQIEQEQIAATLPVEREIVAQSQVEEEEEEEYGMEIEKTAAKIDSAIQQISTQLQEVKTAEALITNQEERTYYDSVVLKLTEQLEELLTIREKIQYYQEIISLSKEDGEIGAVEEEDVAEEAETVQGVAIAAEKPTLTSATTSEKPAILEDQEAVPVVEKQTAIEVDQGDSTVAQSQVRAVASHQQPSTATFTSTLEDDVRDVESIVIPSSSSYVPFPSSTGGLRAYRPAFTHSATPSIGSKMSSSNTRSKKLFEKHRSAINHQAQMLISSFEEKPHFLLSLFKKVQSLSGSDVSQQQLLIMIDELIEETQMEDSQDESLDEDALFASMQNGTFNSNYEHVHVAIQTFVTSLVIGSDAVESYTSKTANEIIRHVCSLLYTELTSSAIRKPVESDEALEVIDQFKPALEQIVYGFQGRVVKDSWMNLVDRLIEFADIVFRR